MLQSANEKVAKKNSIRFKTSIAEKYQERHALSDKGSRANGESRSRCSNIGLLGWLQASLFTPKIPLLAYMAGTATTGLTAGVLVCIPITFLSRPSTNKILTLIK